MALRNMIKGLGLVGEEPRGNTANVYRNEGKVVGGPTPGAPAVAAPVLPPIQRAVPRMAQVVVDKAREQKMLDAQKKKMQEKLAKLEKTRQEREQSALARVPTQGFPLSISTSAESIAAAQSTPLQASLGIDGTLARITSVTPQGAGPRAPVNRTQTGMATAVALAAVQFSKGLSRSATGYSRQPNNSIVTPVSVISAATQGDAFSFPPDVAESPAEATDAVDKVTKQVMQKQVIRDEVAAQEQAERLRLKAALDFAMAPKKPALALNMLAKATPPPQAVIAKLLSESKPAALTQEKVKAIVSPRTITLPELPKPGVRSPTGPLSPTGPRSPTAQQGEIGDGSQKLIRLPSVKGQGVYERETGEIKGEDGAAKVRPAFLKVPTRFEVVTPSVLDLIEETVAQDVGLIGLRVSLLSKDAREDLEKMGAKYGPFWTINRLFPPNLNVALSVGERWKDLDRSGAGSLAFLADRTKASEISADDLADRLLTKSKLLDAEEWQARFLHLLKSVLAYYPDTAPDAPSDLDIEINNVALQAVSIWIKSAMADQPERVFNLMMRQGPLHRRLDELIYLMPEIAQPLENLIISLGLRSEATVRACPVSEFSAAVLTEAMFDRSIPSETGQLAALALGLMEEFSEPYLNTLHGMVTGSSDIERALDASPHMRAAALRALAAVWKEKGVLAYTLQQRDQDGRTLLHLAAENGFYGVVAELLAVGGAIDDQDAFGKTPLILAAIAGQPETIQVLLEKGANTSKKDTLGLTALMHAALHGRSAVIPLFAKFVNPDELSKDGKTALMLACLHGKINCVQPLLSIGASIDAVDLNHRTALLLTCEAQQDAAAGVLLMSGADLQRKDRQGMTALMIAAEAGDVRMVKSLILMLERQYARSADAEFGIDEQAPGRHNMTALMIASALGHEQIVLELLEAGADPLINTDRLPRLQKQGKNALDFAVLANQSRIVEILRPRIQAALELQQKVESGGRDMIDDELLSLKVGEDVFTTYVYATGEQLPEPDDTTPDALAAYERRRRGELDRKLFDEEAFFMFSPHIASEALKKAQELQAASA